MPCYIDFHILHLFFLKLGYSLVLTAIHRDRIQCIDLHFLFHTYTQGAIYTRYKRKASRLFYVFFLSLQMYNS